MLEHSWIVDVCEDLEKYAEMNGLELMASAMKDAICVAKLEVILLANTDACIDVDGPCSCHQEDSNIVLLQPRP